MTSNDSSAAQPKTPNIIVFRDKLLLPSEGFIKTHYTAFDAANLVYIASHFGWRAAELDGQMMATAPDSLRRFWFKQTGRTRILPDLKVLAPQSVACAFWPGRCAGAAAGRGVGGAAFCDISWWRCDQGNASASSADPDHLSKTSIAFAGLCQRVFMCVAICCRQIGGAGLSQKPS